MANPIITENLNTGTTAWDFRSSVATTQIQAYADKCSLDAGQTINFFVSTQVASTTYTVKIFRLGWYGGTGGCLKSTASGRVGVAQGYWDEVGQVLNNCPTAIINNTTHLIEAGWTITDSWTVPIGACTGIYVAEFTDANGKTTAVTFTVRGNANSDYVIVQSDTTDAAYNDWGGWSLYTNPTVGVKVSFNRPQSRAANASQPTNWLVFSFELPAIHWLESQGYDLSYISNVDIHASGSSILTSHKAYISFGHDEYWTLEMKNAVEAARAAGIGLAFLGANTCFWQMRFEADASSNPNRTITCYKCKSFNANLSIDPFFNIDNTRITTNWRDPLLSKSEQLLCGVMFSSTCNLLGWTVDNNANHPLLSGTGLVPGQTYGNDLTGYEFDKVFAGAFTSQPNLSILGTTALTNGQSIADTSNTTVYIGSGGALVFGSGSISWTWALDPWRWTGTTPAVVPGMQSLMTNIMAALIKPRNVTSFSSLAMHS